MRFLKYILAAFKWLNYKSYNWGVGDDLPPGEQTINQNCEAVDFSKNYLEFRKRWKND